jgi:hypothetical protein
VDELVDLSALPYDARCPVVGVDECPSQLVGEVRQPLPGHPGQPQRYDYQYQRQGTGTLFMVVEPRAGWRHGAGTARRTKPDCAHCRQLIVDGLSPEAEIIRVVVDTLNTHTPAAVSDTCPPAAARRILHRLGFQYTPKQGRWLKIVEVDLSVLAGQCRERRLPDPAVLQREIAAWEQARTAIGATVQWRFTTNDARVKLHRLYPS